MAMQTTSDNASGEPMMEINTTPLIDVMLVLLIMFIITIPIQTHAVKLDLPVNQPNQPPPPIDPIKNTVVVNAAGPDPVERLAGHRGAAAPVSRRDAADEPGSRSFTCSPTRPRATSWSTRCWRSPSRRTSRRWASSATNII